jgi:hypothetical protein
VATMLWTVPRVRTCFFYEIVKKKECTCKHIPNGVGLSAASIFCVSLRPATW